MQCPKCNYQGDSNQVGEHLIYFHRPKPTKPQWQPQYYTPNPRYENANTCPICGETMNRIGFKYACPKCDYTVNKP